MKKIILFLTLVSFNNLVFANDPTASGEETTSSESDCTKVVEAEIEEGTGEVGVLETNTGVEGQEE